MRRSKGASPTKPKYYLYVSASKVEMLFSQIPRGLMSRLAVEVGVDLKVLSFSVKDAPTEETLYSKATVVSEYIRRNLSIGSVDEPSEYFAATLPMRVGPYGYADGSLLWFSGATEGTVVGLGGSRHNAIGEVRGSSTFSHSITAAIVVALRDELPPESRPSPDERDAVLADLLMEVPNTEHPQGAVLGAVSLAVANHRGPAEVVEFLARRLLQGPNPYVFRGEPSHVLLGTPIYAALAE